MNKVFIWPLSKNISTAERVLYLTFRSMVMIKENCEETKSFQV
jgi:hypothetical protein